MPRPFTPNFLPPFSEWLAKSGADIRAPHTEWELLRFYSPSGACGIIYTNSRRQLTVEGAARDAWEDFASQKPWREKSKVPRPRNTFKFKLVQELLARDGNKCLLCGLPMEAPSLEHLLDLKFGGSNHLSNLALVHPECNAELEKLPHIVAKINTISQRRLECASTNSNSPDSLLHPPA